MLSVATRTALIAVGVRAERAVAEGVLVRPGGRAVPLQEVDDRRVAPGRGDITVPTRTSLSCTGLIINLNDMGLV